MYEDLPRLEIPFRNSQNQRYSKQLFWEEWIRLEIENRTVYPVFTLYEDREGLVNFGQEYINDCDPSGYNTAMRLLGSYDYFTYLLKSPWFKRAKEIWDNEIEARLYAEGLSKVRELAKGDDAKALVAAKYLANKDWKEGKGRKGASSRGRPTKDEIEGALKQEVNDHKLIEADFQRIRSVK